MTTKALPNWLSSSWSYTISTIKYAFHLQLPPVWIKRKITNLKRNLRQKNWTFKFVSILPLIPIAFIIGTYYIFSVSIYFISMVFTIALLLALTIIIAPFMYTKKLFADN